MSAAGARGPDEVRWEVHPLVQAWDGDGLRQSGHEFQFTCRAPDLDPGCPRCAAAYDRIRDVALAALPGGELGAMCHLRPFETALRFRPGPDLLEPEIELDVEVEGVAAGDPRERLCVLAIEERLRALGIPHS